MRTTDVKPDVNRLTRRLASAVMLAVAVTLAGCSAAGNDTATPGGTATATPTASPSASEKETPTMPPSTPPASTPGSTPGGPTFDPAPSSPAKPAGQATTVTGTVSLGVEAGCLMLDAGKAQYQLVGGDRNLLRPGRSVKVVGTVRTDLLTTCQQGTPLVVQKAELA